MADWHVGQRVVCVEATPFHVLYYMRYPNCQAGPDPLVGEVYTIEAIFDDYDNPGEVCFVLTECTPDFGYESNMFRPVRQAKNDISIFRELLNKINSDISVSV